MPVSIELRDNDGIPVRGLPDPSGGVFDAAGDFDRYIDNDRLGVLGGIDPHADTHMSSGRMQGLIRDIDVALASAHEGPEARGLLRLKELARRCQNDATTHLFIAGD